jgi:hypothetical protein
MSVFKEPRDATGAGIGSSISTVALVPRGGDAGCSGRTIAISAGAGRLSSIVGTMRSAAESSATLNGSSDAVLGLSFAIIFGGQRAVIGGTGGSSTSTVAVGSCGNDAPTIG